MYWKNNKTVRARPQKPIKYHKNEPASVMLPAVIGRQGEKLDRWTCIIVMYPFAVVKSKVPGIHGIGIELVCEQHL